MKKYRVPVSKKIYGYVDVFAEEGEEWDAAWQIISDETFVPEEEEFDMEYCGSPEEIDSQPNSDLWR